MNERFKERREDRREKRDEGKKTISLWIQLISLALQVWRFFNTPKKQ